MKDALAKSSANDSPSILNPFITVEYIPSVSGYSRISFTMTLNKYGPKPLPWQISFQFHNYPLAQNSAITKIKCYCMILCRVLGCLDCLGGLGFSTPFSRCRDFAFHNQIQADCRSYPASFSMYTEVFLLLNDTTQAYTLTCVQSCFTYRHVMVLAHCL